MPNLNLTINEQTGLLSKEREEVDKLIASSLEYAEVEAAQESLGDIAKEKYKTEQSLNDMYAERNSKQEEYNKLTDTWLKYQELSKKGYVWLSKEEKEYYNTNKNVIDQMGTVSQEIKDLNDSVESAENSVNSLGKEWNETSKYIGDHSSINSATAALDGFFDKYRETLEQQNQDYAEGLDDRVDAVEKTYKISEKALEKSLKTEQKTLEKAQKAELKEAEDAAEDKVKIKVAEYDKKIALIKKEYLYEKGLKDAQYTTDISAVQGKIDEIDAQSEAEERAAADKEEAEKRAELTAQIASAKTAEERLEAQKELVDFEEETAKDRLKTERKLQKDILEEQKDTINEAYEADIKALEDTKKADETKAQEWLENKKKKISEELVIEKEKIEDIQEIEKQALDDKQEDDKDYLADKKADAIQSAKDTYEEDLRQFKLNNALKYDEAVANEAKIQKYLAEQSYGPMMSVNELQNKLSKTNLTGLDPLYKTTGIRATGSSSLPIDYGKFQDAMEAALKKDERVVMLNGKVVGRLVDKQVNSSLR